MRMNLSSRIAVAALAVVAGCGDSAATKPAPGPAGSPAPKVPLVHTKQAADWCGEHGVPESICSRCNDSLVAGFKAKGDWCKEHDLPESQCFACHPELEAKFKASAPK